jgi:hypothetical protein
MRLLVGFLGGTLTAYAIQYYYTSKLFNASVKALNQMMIDQHHSRAGPEGCKKVGCWCCGGGGSPAIKFDIDSTSPQLT